eukprot:m51a1_g13929 hypothetical protein (1035) ;mRNA; f:839248-843170
MDDRLSTTPQPKPPEAGHAAAAAAAVVPSSSPPPAVAVPVPLARAANSRDRTAAFLGARERCSAIQQARVATDRLSLLEESLKGGVDVTRLKGDARAAQCGVCSSKFGSGLLGPSRRCMCPLCRSTACTSCCSRRISPPFCSSPLAVCSLCATPAETALRRLAFRKDSATAARDPLALLHAELAESRWGAERAIERARALLAQSSHARSEQLVDAQDVLSAASESVLRVQSTLASNPAFRHGSAAAGARAVSMANVRVALNAWASDARARISECELQSRALSLIEPPPAVASVEPRTAPVTGGTALTVRGEGLVRDIEVIVGGVKCPSVEWRSDTEVVAMSPAAPAGMASLVVRNPTSGATASLENAIQLVPATLTSDAETTSSFEPRMSRRRRSMAVSPGEAARVKRLSLCLDSPGAARAAAMAAAQYAQESSGTLEELRSERDELRAALRALQWRLSVLNAECERLNDAGRLIRAELDTKHADALRQTEGLKSLLLQAQREAATAQAMASAAREELNARTLRRKTLTAALEKRLDAINERAKHINDRSATQMRLLTELARCVSEAQFEQRSPVPTAAAVVARHLLGTGATSAETRAAAFATATGALSALPRRFAGDPRQPIYLLSTACLLLDVCKLPQEDVLDIVYRPSVASPRDNSEEFKYARALLWLRFESYKSVVDSVTSSLKLESVWRAEGLDAAPISFALTCMRDTAVPNNVRSQVCTHVCFWINHTLVNALLSRPELCTCAVGQSVKSAITSVEQALGRDERAAEQMMLATEAASLLVVMDTSVLADARACEKTSFSERTRAVHKCHPQDSLKMKSRINSIPLREKPSTAPPQMLSRRAPGEFNPFATIHNGDPYIDTLSRQRQENIEQRQTDVVNTFRQGAVREVFSTAHYIPCPEPEKEVRPPELPNMTTRPPRRGSTGMVGTTMFPTQFLPHEPYKHPPGAVPLTTPFRDEPRSPDGSVKRPMLTSTSRSAHLREFSQAPYAPVPPPTPVKSDASESLWRRDDPGPFRPGGKPNSVRSYNQIK